MKRLLTLILSSSAVLLALPTPTFPHPPRENRGFNSGVHQTIINPSGVHYTFPGTYRTNYRNNSGYCDNCGYSVPYRREYRQNYRQGYHNSDFRGQGYYPYPREYQRYREGSRIRVEYEQSW